MFEDIIASSKQLPVSTVAKDLVALIARLPLTDKEAFDLYEAIRGRLKSKSCSRCRLLKVEGFEGSVVDWVGFGRQFVCSGCQGILLEKGQITQ